MEVTITVAVAATTGVDTTKDITVVAAVVWVADITEAEEATVVVGETIPIIPMVSVAGEMKGTPAIKGLTLPPVPPWHRNLRSSIV